jgi:hypothetical protein
MAEGYTADVNQIRAHANAVEAVRDGFGRIKAASAFIAGDDQAYGILCAWMPRVLQGRHTHQDELFDFVEENLSLIADGLRQTAEAYAGAETAVTDHVQGILRDLTGGGAR